MIEGSRAGAQPRRRDALDALTWKRVKDVARARMHQGPRGRTSSAAAHRDLAVVLVLGEMGLRSEEARTLITGSIAPKRSDGLTPWLTVHGKGAKTRELPIPPEVADALLAWLEHRQRILSGPGILFPGSVANGPTAASPTRARESTSKGWRSTMVGSRHGR